MAPSKRKDHVENDTKKTEIFGPVKHLSKIPEAFLSLKDAMCQYDLEVEVNFGKNLQIQIICFLSNPFKDFKSDGLLYEDPDCAVRGKRNGQEGIFFAPNFLLDVL